MPYHRMIIYNKNPRFSGRIGLHCPFDQIPCVLMFFYMARTHKNNCIKLREINRTGAFSTSGCPPDIRVGVLLTRNILQGFHMLGKEIGSVKLPRDRTAHSSSASLVPPNGWHSERVRLSWTIPAFV